MNKLSVSSSNIDSIGYDEDTQTLEIDFNSGATYQFKDVPVDVWNKFKGSASKGRFFRSQIKDSYSATRM
jgi:hypothetical protein